jgi:hypothetical protein
MLLAGAVAFVLLIACAQSRPRPDWHYATILGKAGV